MTRAEQVIAAARAAIETPFRHQGRIVGRGLDCAGLAIHCAHSAGVLTYDENDYPRNPGGGRLESAFDKQPELTRIPVSEILPGDVLLMRFDGQPQHVAIMVDGGNIVHAYQPSGRVVEHILSAVWQRRIVRAYRFIEMTE